MEVGFILINNSSANTSSIQCNVKGLKTIYDDPNYTMQCNGETVFIIFHISSITIKKWTNFQNLSLFSDSKYSKYLPSYIAWGSCNYSLTSVMINTTGGVEIQNQTSYDFNGYVNGSITYPMK